MASGGGGNVAEEEGPDGDDPKDTDYQQPSGDVDRAGDGSVTPPVAKSATKRPSRATTSGSRKPASAPRRTRSKTAPAAAPPSGSKTKGKAPAGNKRKADVASTQDAEVVEPGEVQQAAKRKRLSAPKEPVVPTASQDPASRIPSLFVFGDTDGRDTKALITKLQDHFAARRFRQASLPGLKGHSCIQCAHSQTQCTREHNTKSCHSCTARNLKCSFLSCQYLLSLVLAIPLTSLHRQHRAGEGLGVRRPD